MAEYEGLWGCGFSNYYDKGVDMTKQITVSNPDRQGIYHCWHYCRGCGETWTHSQGDWEDIKRHVMLKHKDDWSLIATTPTDYLIAEVIIQ